MVLKERSDLDDISNDNVCFPDNTVFTITIRGLSSKMHYFLLIWLFESEDLELMRARSSFTGNVREISSCDFKSE